MVQNTKNKLEKNGIEKLPFNNLLFDTNIFIYHLNAEPHVEKLFSKDSLSANNIYYSIITEIELLSFPKLNEEESKVIKGLLEKFSQISLTEEIKEKTIEIKRNFKIGIADAVIAATAITLNASLVTRDETGFNKIKELTFINPFV